MADGQRFKGGDVVKLKSGGPSMTVTHVFDSDEGTACASCTWFGDTKVCAVEQDFPMSALESIR